MTFEQATQAMYAAYDALQATVKGTDEYLDARMAYADAQANYNAAYNRRMTGFTSTIRKA